VIGPGLELYWGHPTIVDDAKLRKELGVNVPSDYTLAFDAVLKEIAWFEPVPLSPEDMAETWDHWIEPRIAGRYCEKIPKRGKVIATLPDGNVFLLTNAGRVGFGADGHSVWPESEFVEWLDEVLPDPSRRKR